MPKSVEKNDEDSYDGNRSSVLKRKNPHPVRRLFKPIGETQQMCRFCGWVTRENATRMVKHIISVCKKAPISNRRSMEAVVESNAERENRSLISGHNKKDIHSYFSECDNGKKRKCLYCEWKTILNLTRMRNHLVMVCKKVPVSIRAQFLKLELTELKEEDPTEKTQPECESFRIVNVLEDGVGKDFEIISTDQLPEEVESLEVMQEEGEEDVTNQNSTYYYEVNQDDDYIIHEMDENDQQTTSERITLDMADDSCGASESPTMRRKNDEQQQRSTMANKVPVVEEDSNEEDEDDGTIEVEKQQQYETEQRSIENEASEETLLNLNCDACCWCQKSLMANGGTAVMRDRKLYCSRACALAKDSAKIPERQDSSKSAQPERSRAVSGSTLLSSSSVAPKASSTPIPSKSTDNEAVARENSLRKRILLGSKPILRQKAAITSRVTKPMVTAPQSPKKRGNNGPLLRSVKVSAIKKEDAPKQMQQRQKEKPPTKEVIKKMTPIRSSTSSMDTEAAVSEEGSCHSFGGGQVYPQEAPQSVDHKLQYTKAVISRPAPDFEATAVVDGAFKKVKLSDYLGKYLVFFFYPLDFTFVCPTEILAFSDRVEEFRKLNTEVIAASIDSHFTHLAWINTPRKEGGLGKINIPLVSDITHSIAKDYGVFLDDLGHTLRGLFIIDNRGILRQITMNDLPVGRSVDETLRLVQAFQYTDQHGEVCPAGWKPGQDTIVPNPEAKIKYFERNN
uniref:thioredoxin-dependent peroxiredoxin n=2 Tax=Anopheles triannulatus TaxID=58253 RepID=A0A2M4A940_9DIPT